MWKNFGTKSTRAALITVCATAATCLVVVAAIAKMTNEPLPSWTVSPMAANVPNPVPADANSIAAGKSIYSQNCTACHGSTGVGNGPAGQYLNPKPFNLTSASLWQLSDGTLFAMISQGHSPMPGFAGSLSKHQRWDLINYLRTLAPAPTKPTFKTGSDLRSDISSVLDAYLATAAALTKKDDQAARSHVSDLSDAVDTLQTEDLSKLSAKAKTAWASTIKALSAATAKIKASSSLQSTRSSFALLSKAMIKTVKQFGHGENHPLFVFDCPKAFNGGEAQWLQSKSQPTNPYGDANCSDASLCLYAATK